MSVISLSIQHSSTSSSLLLLQYEPVEENYSLPQHPDLQIMELFSILVYLYLFVCVSVLVCVFICTY